MPSLARYTLRIGQLLEAKDFILYVLRGIIIDYEGVFTSSEQLVGYDTCCPDIRTLAIVEFVDYLLWRLIDKSADVAVFAKVVGFVLSCDAEIY